MERDFPQQYSKPLRKVLKALSFGTPNVIGSSADHRVLYSADYDLVEDVIVRRNSAKLFQRKVQAILKVGKIVDIKIGEISEWNLLKKPYIKDNKVHNYKQKDELAHLAHLWQTKIITHDEFMTATEMLQSHLSPEEFLLAKKELRFGLLRWTISEVVEGYKELRDQKPIWLEDAFKTKGITKLDLIAWVNNKYTEFSNIVLWTNRSGKPYAYIPALKKGLMEDILLFQCEKNYVKLAKRMLSLAKQYKDTDIVDKLTTILNSPLGKLYMLTADLEVLDEFPQAITQARKRQELDLMRDYFAKLYFPELNKAVPNIALLPKLQEILQDEMEIALKNSNLLPVPRDYRI
jgi:hypothetical protein